jgi:hypothetical protein
MRSPEILWKWCMEKCGGDQRVAVLMMEAAAKVMDGDHSFGHLSLFVLGKKTVPIAA